MNYQKDLEKVRDLKVGQECTINWSEESGGIVRYFPGIYYLYEVGMYGGWERLYSTYFEYEIEKMLDVAYTWT